MGDRQMREGADGKAAGRGDTRNPLVPEDGGNGRWMQEKAGPYHWVGNGQQMGQPSQTKAAMPCCSMPMRGNSRVQSSIPAVNPKTFSV